MRGEHAWAALIGAVTAWEVFALRTDPDRLLSRAVDRTRDRHPIVNAAVSVVIVATAGHLLRALGPYDPYSLVSR